MAWTQTDIDRLKAAMATGARRVEYGSGETRRVVEYRSLSEMESILKEMQDDIAGPLAPQRIAITQFTRD